MADNTSTDERTIDGPRSSIDGTALEQLQRRRTIEQATDEGHDADIPSSTGFILTESGELKRKRSIVEHRRRSSSAAWRRESVHDVEQGSDAFTKREEAAPDLSEDENNVVWWDGDEDPENPYNWPAWRKIVNCSLISALTFLTPLASSMFAPGVPEVMQEFKSTNTELAGFVVSIYVLGYAAGPPFLAPLSEVYGRLPVYHVCNLMFVVFSIACAVAPSLGSLIAFRFLAGTFGACPLTNGGGSIADMITQEKRAIAMSMFSLGPLVGPILGPVAGGFLSSAKGWRWVFWVLTIVSGFISVLMLITLKESYAPVVLQRKVRRLQKETGHDLLRSKLDSGLSQGDYFKRSIVRPMRMLIFSPICAIFALYMVVVYGYLYLLFTSVTYVFQEYYHFSTDIIGLVFLGLGVGSLIGMFVYAWDNGRDTKKHMENGGAKPELRLKLLPLGAIVLPAGFFIYGWTVEYRVHWIVPIIGMSIIGIGNIICFMSISMYLVDAFTMYAASALAANTIIRSIAGATLPLCGLQMYDKLGLGWGNSLLGFIAVALIPIPFLIRRYGEHLRTTYEIKNL